VKNIPNREAKYSENGFITQKKVNLCFQNYENGPEHLSAVYILRYVMKMIELIVIISFYQHEAFLNILYISPNHSKH
jgi:hypothetical protein